MAGMLCGTPLTDKGDPLMGWQVALLVGLAAVTFWAALLWLICRAEPGWPNVRLGGWSGLLAPAYGTCSACGTPWLFVRPRVVEYRHGLGIVVLCVKCWTDMNVQERLAAHMRVVQGRSDSWELWPRVSWAIRRDTLAEQWPDLSSR